MARASPALWPATSAMAAFGAYLVLALGPTVGLPFVRFPAFQFPMTHEATAVPVFLADGERADIRAYTDFAGIDPEAVDLRHHGLACSVEHLLHEQQNWLRSHQAADGTAPGPTRVEIGLRILALDDGGRLVTTTRIDAAGTARPR